ncbi:MAG: hypothetical protein M3Q22_07630 [Actinomycetota bacterium]|nr:hypothetical protein [Actinomycetota bacterium]
MALAPAAVPCLGPRHGIAETPRGLVQLALPLMALGLPWNLPTFIDPYQFDGLSPLLWSLVYFGPAFLDVALHGALFWFVSRRRRRRPGSAAGLAQG